MNIQFSPEKLTINYLEINDGLAKQIENKVIQSLEKHGAQAKHFVITEIELVKTDDETIVDLVVKLLNVEETVHISFARSEFNRLHYINPDNVTLHTFKIDDVDIPDELLRVIKEKLINELADSHQYYGDFRKCEAIRVLRIVKTNTNDCPDKINLDVEISYDCTLSVNIDLTFDKSELNFDKISISSPDKISISSPNESNIS